MSIEVVTQMPGTIVSIAVAVGDHVAAGQEMAVIESMKMEVPIEAPLSGTVNAVVMAEMAVANEGDVVFRIDPD